MGRGTGLTTAATAPSRAPLDLVGFDAGEQLQPKGPFEPQLWLAQQRLARTLREARWQQPDVAIWGLEPHWAEELLSGRMRWEVQAGGRYTHPGSRVALRLTKGKDPKGITSIVGYADIGQVIEGDSSRRDEIWEQVKDGIVISRGAFDSYVRDKRFYVSRVDNVQRLAQPIPTPSNLTSAKANYLRSDRDADSSVIAGLEQRDLQLLEANGGVYPIGRGSAPSTDMLDRALRAKAASEKLYGPNSARPGA